MTRTFDRDAAFETRLGSDGGDAIQKMIVLEGQLYAFTTSRIYILRTANDIDPDRTAPDTRHSHQEIFSVGCSNPIVAQSIIQAKQILGAVVLRLGLNKTIVLDAIWEVTRLLLRCENAQFQIYNEAMSLTPICDQLIESSKFGASIPSLPQIQDLEERVNTFLGYAKRCLEKTHALLGIFYGCPDLDANFASYRDWMSANRGESQAMIELLTDDRDWIRFVAHARNALDVNHSRPNFKLEVRNFELHPGNKFSGPAWRHDMSDRNGPIQKHWSPIIEEMDALTHNLLTFLEDFFALCVADHVDRNSPLEFAIVPVPTEQIREECPVRFMAQPVWRSR